MVSFLVLVAHCLDRSWILHLPALFLPHVVLYTTFPLPVGHPHPSSATPNWLLADAHCRFTATVTCCLPAVSTLFCRLPPRCAIYRSAFTFCRMLDNGQRTRSSFDHTVVAFYYLGLVCHPFWVLGSVLLFVAFGELFVHGYSIYGIRPVVLRCCCSYVAFTVVTLLFTLFYLLFHTVADLPAFDLHWFTLPLRCRSPVCVRSDRFDYRLPVTVTVPLPGCRSRLRSARLYGCLIALRWFCSLFDLELFVVVTFLLRWSVVGHTHCVRSHVTTAFSRFHFTIPFWFDPLFRCCCCVLRWSLRLFFVVRYVRSTTFLLLLFGRLPCSLPVVLFVADCFVRAICCGALRTRLPPCPPRRCSIVVDTRLFERHALPFGAGNFTGDPPTRHRC